MNLFHKKHPSAVTKKKEKSQRNDNHHQNKMGLTKYRKIALDDDDKKISKMSDSNSTTTTPSNDGIDQNMDASKNTDDSEDDRIAMNTYSKKHTSNSLLNTSNTSPFNNVLDNECVRRNEHDEDINKDTSLTDIQYPHLNRILTSKGPFSQSDFIPTNWGYSLLPVCRVLVVGAGALGCEILKNLVLSGFTQIDIIDMDIIEWSNLNRQFLFLPENVGQSKALVAAASFPHLKHVSITPHYCKIQEKDLDFYKSFHLVICGLDSVEARRWMNATLVSLVEENKENGQPDLLSIIPLIDGGTEGFKGQARLILPKISACIECTLDLFPPQKTTYPLCTIAHTPRLPEHCIEWAILIEWPRLQPNLADFPFDPDDPAHVEDIWKLANVRAKEFGIPNISLHTTLSVVKNIIPAMVSTNAIIAASCVLEAFKLVTKVSNNLSDYLMINGADSFYSFSFKPERKDDCPVCGIQIREITCASNVSLEDFIDQYKELFSSISEDNIHGGIGGAKLTSIRLKAKTLYMSHPPSMEEATRHNLKEPLIRLFESGSILSITNTILPNPLFIQVFFK